MKTIIEQVARQSLLTLALTFLAANVVAGEYDYEVGLSYGNSSTDRSSPILVTGGNPGSQFGSFENSSDSDRVELSGTWYYSGLSDKSGPKSRAAFLDRASGVRLSYAYENLSGSYESSGLQPPLPPGVILPPGFPPIPPSTGSSDGTTNALEVSLRHVWKASGWYGLAGATRIDTQIDSDIGGNSTSFDADATAYTLGIGKYFGQATALDLSIISADVEGSDTTTYALSFNHVGKLGDNWHYAADLGFAVSDFEYIDGDSESYSVGFSLFPTTELEFGIEVVRPDGPIDGDSNTYEGFVSWFVRENVELNASYRNADREFDSLTEIDSNQFAVGVNVRF